MNYLTWENCPLHPKCQRHLFPFKKNFSLWDKHPGLNHSASVFHSHSSFRSVRGPRSKRPERNKQGFSSPFQVLPGALKAAAPQPFSRLWLSPATPWAAPAVSCLHLHPTGAQSPLNYSCLENPMEKSTWWVTVHRVTKSQNMPEVTQHDAHMHVSKDLHSKILEYVYFSFFNFQFHYTKIC